MSRLIVKNLPSTNEDKLRKIFADQGGDVTDVQLKYTKDGKFRHFGFVGYKSEEDAQKAIRYFNGTYIGATKVSVELCADLGDLQNKPRAWSKYASDSSAYKQVHQDEIEEKSSDLPEKKKGKKEKKKEKQAKVDALLEKYKDDSKFQEFLRIHKRNSLASETWNNDAILEAGLSYETQEGVETANEVVEETEPTKDVEESEIQEENKVALDKKLSDLDYLKSLSETKGSDDKVDNEPSPTDDKGETANANKKTKQPKNEDYFTVKISGLPYKAKKKDVKQFLNPIKPKSIRVPQKIKGIAFAGFATEKEWKNALNKNKSFIGSNRIFVIRYDKKGSDSSASKSKEAGWKNQEESIKNEESVAESGRLFIRNLSYTVVESDIENLFKKFGPLAEVTLPIG